VGWLAADPKRSVPCDIFVRAGRAGIEPAYTTPTEWTPLHFLVLLLLSLPAMYARQADEAGWLGLIGHALLQTGLLLYIVATSPALLFSSFNLPFENSLTAFLLGTALTLGWPLTAIATIQARVHPRWAGILLLVVSAGFFFGFFVAESLPRSTGQVVGTITNILQGLALAWIGFSMWSGPPRPTT
jgi:hypothetical protein